jgi:hypothetical protein
MLLPWFLALAPRHSVYDLLGIAVSRPGTPNE